MSSTPLLPQAVKPRWVRIELTRCAGDTHKVVSEYRECHFYVMNTDETADLFVIEHGRLHRCMSFNSVLSVEEVDQPA